MATIIQHGDFGFDTEKVEEIAKNIEVVGKKKAFFGQFCRPMTEAVGDKLTLRRQILIDPNAVASLNEGETPRADQIKVVGFSETLNSYGSYIPFSRQAYKENRDSIVEMGRRQLAHNRLYDLEAVRSAAYIGTTYTATKGNDDYWTALGKLKVRLVKNKALPLADGKYGLIVTPEIGLQIAAEAKASGTVLAGTQAGVDVAKNGYVGDWGGFHIYESSYSGLYGAENANICLAFGKTEDGDYPVVSRFADDSNIEVIVHGLGSAGTSDPTNEKGTIASRIDNCGAFLEHPECVIKMTITEAAIAADVPGAYVPSGSTPVTTPTGE